MQRAYDPPQRGGGKRILVERLWPRGLTKERAAIGHWAKEVAPSPALRKWYGHDSSKWKEFRTRYLAELDDNHDVVTDLRQLVGTGPVTFVFGSKEEHQNSAAVLKQYLEDKGPP